MVCSPVLENLWLGPSLREQDDFEYLRLLRITAILSLQENGDRGYRGVDSERATALRFGFAFESFPVQDFSNADLQARLRGCVGTLERLLQRGHTVYVHCHSGISRAPTVVAAYLHWSLGWDLERALGHVQYCRPCYPIEDAIRNARLPDGA